jgi:hypothetical protein
VFELLDLSGAIGHICFDGSKILNEPTTLAFLAAVETIRLSTPDQTIQRVYENYLDARWNMITIDDPENFDRPFWAKIIVRTTPASMNGCKRLACLTRFSEKGKEHELYEALVGMEDLAREVLLTELGKLDGPILYYSPQLVVDHIGQPGDFMQMFNAVSTDTRNHLLISVFNNRESCSKNPSQLLELMKQYFTIENLTHIYTLLSNCYIAISRANIDEGVKLPVYQLVDLVNHCKKKFMNDLPQDLAVKDGSIVPVEKRKLDESTDTKEQQELKRVKCAQ